MIDFSTITDVATLGFVIRAVQVVSRLECKIESLQARVKKLELEKFSFK